MGKICKFQENMFKKVGKNAFSQDNMPNKIGLIYGEFSETKTYWNMPVIEVPEKT